MSFDLLGWSSVIESSLSFYSVFLSSQAPLPSSSQSYLQPTLPLRASCSLSDRAPTFLSNSALHSKSSLTVCLLCSVIHFCSFIWRESPSSCNDYIHLNITSGSPVCFFFRRGSPSCSNQPPVFPGQ